MFCCECMHQCKLKFHSKFISPTSFSASEFLLQFISLADTFCIKMPLALYCYCLLVDSRQCTQHITKHAHDRIFTAKLLFQQYRVLLQKKKKKKNNAESFNTKFLGSLQGRLKSWAHLSQQILKGFIVPIRLYISKKSPKLYFKKNLKIVK